MDDQVALAPMANLKIDLRLDDLVAGLEKRSWRHASKIGDVVSLILRECFVADRAVLCGKLYGGGGTRVTSHEK